MAQVFNPWASPPSTNTLTGDLASFEINDMPEPTDDSEADAQEDQLETSTVLQQAMQVISQQADLINKLMATLGK